VPLRWWHDGARSGAANMARDRALWRQAEAGALGDPVLVLYRWSPPSISLGYHQDPMCVDHAAAVRADVDVVRPPTGGAAVLHDDELTYAVVGRLDAGFGRSVEEIYDTVAVALVRALATMGVRADRRGGGHPASLACFTAAGGHEITVDGRKLVGSALRRGRFAFLQHGSILEGPGHQALADLLSVRASERDRLAQELRDATIDLRALGVRDVEPLAAALAAALAQELRTTAIHGALVARGSES
jgi:lipoate-protein ligase A